MSTKKINKEQISLKDLIMNDPEAKIRMGIKKAQEIVDKSMLVGKKKTTGLVTWQI